MKKLLGVLLFALLVAGVHAQIAATSSPAPALAIQATAAASSFNVNTARHLATRAIRYLSHTLGDSRH